jgi:hypothetical protein
VITRRQLTVSLLATVAIAFGLCVEQAAPADADNPDPLGTESNPYRTFSCTCRETLPAGRPALVDEIRRGMQEGRSAWLPGLPAPTG